MDENELARNILSRYPKFLLQEKIKSFSWAKKSFIESKNERDELEEATKDWIKTQKIHGHREVINRIHAWGFNGRLPPKSTESEEFGKDFLCVVHHWNDKRSNLSQKIDSLEKILCYQKIGIATASKWICFIDQSRFGIYDSRVSAALSWLKSPQKKRVFPIVGRRATTKKKYPPQDSVVSKPRKMAEIYLQYINTLSIVAEITDLTVSEIEMALFMIGE